ncbi:hypothetical protein DPMN_116833 [Dreissena polymorpha]|uniref:Uncharacterized protein n=1 Tax=Dreissena polymorpha TaxID=45954 RepID=A0A9D4KPN2_DREPO|nr:hypothetical protein DPMN_116833 [Dreissena polymorpha]
MRFEIMIQFTGEINNFPGGTVNKIPSQSERNISYRMVSYLKKGIYTCEECGVTDTDILDIVSH